MSKITKSPQTPKREKPKMVWISPQAHQKARILAAQSGITIKELIGIAVDNYCDNTPVSVPTAN